MPGSSIVALIGSPYQALGLLEYVRAAEVRSGLVFVTKVRDPVVVTPTFNALAHLRGFTFRFRTATGFGKPHERTGEFAAEVSSAIRAELPDAPLVLGDYRETLGWRVARDLGREGENLVVLDDGVPTLAIDRTEGGVAPLEWSAAAERDGFLPLPAVTFFSAYAKQLKASPSDIVLENDWAWLRSQYRLLPQSSSVVLVIGQGLARVGLVDEEQDLRYARDLVREARELHPSCTPLYVAHRGESAEKLRGLRDDCEVVRFDVPVELVPIQGGVLPAGIVGNYSAALTSLAAIVPKGLPIHAVRLPLDEFRERGEYIAGIYTQLESGYADSIAVVEPSSMRR
jgi:hypothetical protein